MDEGLADSTMAKWQEPKNLVDLYVFSVEVDANKQIQMQTMQQRLI